MRNLTLPLLRKLANLKFSFVDLTLDMLHLVCTEEKQQALAEERKGSAQTIVEAFVRCTPNYSSVWQDARIVAQQYLAQAISLSLNNKFTEILAAACLNMLECLGQFDPVSSGQYLALYQSYANLSINPQHLNHLNKLPPKFKIIILQHSEDRMRTPSASTAESGKTKDKDKEEKPAADKVLPGAPADMGECVILLADTLLMELPLEALKVLQEDGISSVSRDFSLQLLYNRMHREEGECQLVIIFDLVQSSLSFLRQSKLDVEKSALQLSLERPLDTAILSSLTGVRSNMANQWHSTLRQNAAKLDTIFETLSVSVLALALAAVCRGFMALLSTRNGIHVWQTCWFWHPIVAQLVAIDN
ncbi:Cilia- and flagella-associated protein 46 [Acipenser ruthenus]|uniref:Cilia-and flagella-associated protein 46 n=1 Tax=Acipenser ruthenus TaxID=7906 RepID=A0A444TW25_ACIRT|nr:Cilia- and flagella-associated protein 46 [Acipenser ruthenus]